ncbi:MAG TPA: glycosyltransferase family 39 protein [Myxococcaceae bacterium]|nr:glycosyltransferase family 39 protein [Myxococcaceae bacterium]
MIHAWRWVRVLLVLQLARLAVGSLFELVPQEAYYVFYARHPALSYFDHPGMLAWALALPATLRPPPPVLVRLVPFLFAAVTLVGLVRLARRLVPGAPGRAVLLLATTGAFSILSVIALPDGPLVAAWTWTLCFLADALLDDRRAAWLPAGLCAGLAFDSKYSAVLLLLGAGLLLFALPRGRRQLGSPWPWLGLVVMGLVSAPVWIWNVQHGWASFLFQTAGRVEHARGLSLWNLLGLVGSQLVLVLPPLLWVWGREAVRAAPRLLRGELPPEELFLAAFSLVPAVALLVVSLGAVVKPNWPFPLWVAGALWAARRSGLSLLRWNVLASAVLHALVLVELFAYPVRLGDDTWVGWRSLREQTRARLAPGEFAFSADDYKTTAELLLDGTVEAYGRNLLGQPALQLDFVGLDVRALAGRTGLFLDSDPGRFDDAPSGPPPAALLPRCTRVVEAPALLVRRGERIVRRFGAWRCVDYRPP